MNNNKILNWNNFIKNEAISGTELVGKSMGPGYPRRDDKSISNPFIDVIFSDLTNKFYTNDDWMELHNNYISNGGEPLIGFNKKNLDKVLTFLDKFNEQFQNLDDINGLNYKDAIKYYHQGINLLEKALELFENTPWGVPDNLESINIENIKKELDELKKVNK